MKPLVAKWPCCFKDIFIYIYIYIYTDKCSIYKNDKSCTIVGRMKTDMSHSLTVPDKTGTILISSDRQLTIRLGKQVWKMSPWQIWMLEQMPIPKSTKCRIQTDFSQNLIIFVSLRGTLSAVMNVTDTAGRYRPCLKWLIILDNDVTGSAI